MKARLLNGSCQVFRTASDSQEVIEQAMGLMGHNTDDYELGLDEDFFDYNAQYLDIEAAPGVGITRLKITPLYMEREDIRELVKPNEKYGYYQAFGRG